jgi:AbiV family abortive infection protein
MKPSQYRDFLTCEQLSVGMKAAMQNAARLADDADLLLKAGRFPSASALAILSLEESGKSTILRSMSTASTRAEIVALWKSYRRHLDKHVLSVLPRRVQRGAKRLSELRDCVTDATLDEKTTFDSVKQLGLYTDCFGKGHWSIPIEIIDEGLASSMVKMAQSLSKRSHTVTVRELELWVMHMQQGNTRENLLSWAKAMEQEGLYLSGYADTMADFTMGT